MKLQSWINSPLIEFEFKGDVIILVTLFVYFDGVWLNFQLKMFVVCKAFLSKVLLRYACFRGAQARFAPHRKSCHYFLFGRYLFSCFLPG